MSDIKDVNNLNANGERGRQPSKALFENGTYDIEEFHDVFLEMEDITEYDVGGEAYRYYRNHAPSQPSFVAYGRENQFCQENGNGNTDNGMVNGQFHTPYPVNAGPPAVVSEYADVLP